MVLGLDALDVWTKNNYCRLALVRRRSLGKGKLNYLLSHEVLQHRTFPGTLSADNSDLR